MNEDWGAASVSYGDWHGTVAMDNPEDFERLEEYARIDSERWLICGIELYGGTEGTGLIAQDYQREPSVAWVLAVERAEWERLGMADGIRAGQRIAVTRFPVRESDGVSVLEAMKRWSIRASLRSVAAAQLVVVDEAV